jgi:hypothetical protein
MKSIAGTCFLLVVMAAGMDAQRPRYGVTVTAEKGVDYAGFKSYSWTQGQPSPSKSIDSSIVAAVDREMSALGMTKAATGPGDVLVTYYSLTRTDIDPTKKTDAKGDPVQYQVGSLTIAFLDPGSRRSLLRLRLDTPLDTDPAKRNPAIDAAVTELFASYPTRKRE